MGDGLQLANEFSRHQPRPQQVLLWAQSGKLIYVVLALIHTIDVGSNGSGNRATATSDAVQFIV